MSIQVAHAPISSPVESQSYQMWFESVGRFAVAATTSQSKVLVDGSKLHSVISGAMTLINYTGKGGFTAALPNAAKYKALIPVSDGTVLIVEAGSNRLALPEYKDEVTIHGSYICA